MCIAEFVVVCMKILTDLGYLAKITKQNKQNKTSLEPIIEVKGRNPLDKRQP